MIFTLLHKDDPHLDGMSIEISVYIFQIDQALLGELPDDEVKKLDKNLGSISNARWMSPVIACGKSQLYDAQIPASVMSKKERGGNNLSNCRIKSTK